MSEIRALHGPVLLLACGLALVAWRLTGPRGDLRAADGASWRPIAGPFARSIDGEVVVVGEDTVSLAPDRAARLRRLPIAPVLARQLRVGDRVQAELGPGPDGPRVTRLRFLRRAAPEPEPEPDGALPLGAVLPALTVPGVDGPLRLGAGQGTPTVLAFLFTSCGLPTACPLVAEKLRRLQAAIRGRGRIVTLTLDPDVDSLAVLRRYAAARGADPGTWKLGRLPLPQLEPLLRQAGVVRVAGEAGILHGLRLVLLDADGRVAWRSDGNGWEVADLAGRLRALDGGRP